MQTMGLSSWRHSQALTHAIHTQRWPGAHEQSHPALPGRKALSGSSLLEMKKF